MHQAIDIDEYVPKALRTECTYERALLFFSNETNIRLLHAVMGMCTEVGELQDQVKKASMYGKTLDLKNLKEECGDLFWYIAILCAVLQVTPSDILAENIAKLTARYPEKFTSEKALNRDIVAELNAMENTNAQIKEKNS